MRDEEPAVLVVLGVLMTDAMHGYEINKFMSEYLDNVWHISTSQIYLILQRLEKNKLVTVTITFQENWPVKKMFAITVEGKKKFLDWVRRPTRHVRNIRSDFLTKLFFISHLKLQDGIRLVESQIDLLEDLREKVKSEWNHQQNGYRKVVTGFKLGQFDACISWLKSDVGTYIRSFTENTTVMTDPKS